MAFGSKNLCFSLAKVGDLTGIICFKLQLVDVVWCNYMICFDAGGKQVKKETKLGMITSRTEDFGRWYQELVLEAELISYYDVSGEPDFTRITCFFVKICFVDREVQASNVLAPAEDVIYTLDINCL